MIKDSSSQAPGLSSPVVLFGLIVSLGTAICVYSLMFPWHTDDTDIWFVPWLNAIVAQGTIRTLAEPMNVTVEGTNGYANYNPPYLYLLTIGSYAHTLLGSMTIVKLVSAAGNVFCATCVYRLLRCFCDLRRSLLAASTMLILPTLALNAAAWGQSDAIYSGLALLVVASALRNEWILMMIALGAGLAFKLQTAFIGPFVLYVFVSRRVPWWTTAIPPLIYILFLLPAWFAGRPAWDLANVYVEQANAYHWLSMNAPNPWTYIQHLHLLTYEEAVLPGTVFAAFVGAAIVSLAFFVRLERETLLLLAATVATAMPYFLPKMHDRYFMIAELLCYCLAVVRPSRWAFFSAAAMQAGSVGAYVALLFNLRIGTYLGVFPISMALAILAYKLHITIQSRSVQPARPVYPRG